MFCATTVGSARQIPAEHGRDQPAGKVGPAAARIADDHRDGLALE
jgi:hypothetical protein